ncbi:MAG: hypothetical protein Ct9H90mP16_17530 [Candidatus Poseidoniales archaeon]|nr:MAG: hypothetical protein Ct9H90mP16_17530 [Candidatus Poseidoniales archaeon]
MFYAHGSAKNKTGHSQSLLGMMRRMAECYCLKTRMDGVIVYSMARRFRNEAELVTRISPTSWLQGDEVRTPARGCQTLPD